MNQGDFEGLTFSFLRENHGDDLKVGEKILRILEFRMARLWARFNPE